MSPTPLSPMAQALKDHDEETITTLASQGAKLSSNEIPAVLMVDGFNYNDLDQFHTQDETRIGKVVQAAVTAGIDVNAPVNNEPASHYLTRAYTRRQMNAEYDTSYVASIGMREDNYMGMLKAYAVNGVDFRSRDENGKSFMEAGLEEAKTYAQTHHPQTTASSYSQEHEFDKPAFSRVEKDITASLQDIKQAVRHHTIKTSAHDLTPKPTPPKAREQDTR